MFPGGGSLGEHAQRGSGRCVRIHGTEPYSRPCPGMPGYVFPYGMFRRPQTYVVADVVRVVDRRRDRVLEILMATGQTLTVDLRDPSVTSIEIDDAVPIVHDSDAHLQSWTRSES